MANHFFYFSALINGKILLISFWVATYRLKYNIEVFRGVRDENFINSNKQLKKGKLTPWQDSSNSLCWETVTQTNSGLELLCKYKNKTKTQLWKMKIHCNILYLSKKNERKQNYLMMDGISTYKDITKFSEEHVTIVQLQGSTASLSQFFKAPCGSFSEPFMLINACTISFHTNLNKGEKKRIKYWGD